MVQYKQNRQRKWGKIVKIDELYRAVKAMEARDGKIDANKVHELLAEMGYDEDNFYQEVAMQSRFIDAQRDISYGREKLNLHSHEFYEVLYCRSNSGIQYLVETERYRLQRGDIVFIPPGIGHRPILSAEMAEPYEREVLWMSTEFINGLECIFAERAPKWGKSPILLRTAGTRWEVLGNYFHIGVKEAEQRAYGWQTALCGNTMRLLVMLKRALQDDGSVKLDAEKPELLDEVVNYIEANLAEKITLSNTAKRFWVSESTISQTFRQKMDVSFHHFITQRRLIVAKSMILEGTPMDEVSERVGFADYSAFYRAFKQEFGISPRQYRKMQA